MLNQQIQRHPLKPKLVNRGMVIRTFSTYKLLEQIDYGDDVYEKTSTNLMRDPIQEVDI